MDRKSSGLAAVLSFFIPGLGQVYNGEFGKATGFILASIVGGFLTSIFIGFLIILVTWVWAVLDAYQSAESINSALLGPDN